ncbi:MAG: cell wall hydrolase [Pseudomonadota bacterium]
MASVIRGTTLAVFAAATLLACSEESEPVSLDGVAFPIDQNAEQEPPEPPRDPYALEDPISCLAMVMYHEARGEGTRAMRAVGHVVLNRMTANRFPDTVCAVVRQGGERPPCQFSWWCDGRSDLPKEPRAWERCEALAKELLAGESEDPTAGATYFYSGPDPYWAASFRETARIGGHIFMAED